MLERILCPKCKNKLLSEKVTQEGSYFICTCGYDSRGNANKKNNIKKDELLSQLMYLEKQCKEMKNEICEPEALKKHIEIIPKIYESIKQSLNG